MRCFILLAAVVAGAVLASDDVVVLTDANFDDEIKKFQVALVKFYAPWCRYSKELAPEFDKAASELKSNDPPIALVQVDCMVEGVVCQQFGVYQFPTLKIFRNGLLAEDYEGPRDAEGITEYMRGLKE